MSLFISFVRYIQKKSVRNQMKGQSFPSGVEVISDINYLDDNSEFHTLDIYYPSGLDKDLPVLVSVHGGAFVGGDKFYNKEFCMRLSLNGFVVVNINYDLAPNKSLTQMVSCLNEALEWVYDNISSYHGNIHHIYGLGDSAGGWQVLTYSIVNKSEELRSIYHFNHKNSLEFESLVLICPVANVKKAMDKHSKIKWFRHALYKGKKSGIDYEKTSIQDLIKYGNIPESIIVTTSNDHYYYQSLELHELFEKNNVAHTIYSFDSINNKINHCFNIMHPQYIESKNANEKILNFLVS